MTRSFSINRSGLFRLKKPTSGADSSLLASARTLFSSASAASNSARAWTSGACQSSFYNKTQILSLSGQKDTGRWLSEFHHSPSKARLEAVGRRPSALSHLGELGLGDLQGIHLGLHNLRRTVVHHLGTEGDGETKTPKGRAVDTSQHGTRGCCGTWSFAKKTR